LIAYDPVPFDSAAPNDLLFSFGDDVITFNEIDEKCVGFDLRTLLDGFIVHRLFVPRGFKDAARAHLKANYAKIGAESGAPNGE
jgi:hypothetical protein